MKKILSIILSILVIIPVSVALAADGYTPPVDEITKEEAYQFAEEINEMNTAEYDVSSRLIVSANKDIDYMDAVDVATGIDGLYVLQFPNAEKASEAYDYYNSLSYVNYVEHDNVEVNALCEVKDDFDFIPQCYSTVNCNIDDAIKLLHRECKSIPEIKVAICDTGVAKTIFTQDRLLGGYSFLEGYSADGTQDDNGHGTKVAGTIIINTLENVKLYSYQIINANKSGTLSTAISAIYLAVSDGCKIINCSYAYATKSNDKYSIIEAVDYATKQGCIVVAGAGNDSKDVELSNNYPALVPSAITVGAVDHTNKLASFSNYGNGVDIYATGKGMTSYNTNGSQVIDWSGTSAATPVIVSVVSLMLCVNPDLTVQQIEKLLLETGSATDEDNISVKNRVIVDAYEVIKVLTEKELEKVPINYFMSKNPDTIYTDISFFSDDDATIYYNLGSGGNLYIPFRDMYTEGSYIYEKGTTLNLNKWRSLTVCAYAPGKAKSKVEYIMAPIYCYDSGFLLNKANETQQYNVITRCQLNDKVVKVPNEIDGCEVQEIGKYCFMGNKDIETIILPESVVKIDEYAFANCPNLKTVIATGVTKCCRYAFYQCENLVNVEIPNLTYANTGLFKNCISLETAKLGTLTEIDNHAFYGCENLKLVKTTDDNISFSINTFKDCDLLTLYTPSSDTSIYKFGKDNDIPVITSFDYKYTTAKNGKVTYKDAETDNTVTYKADNVRRMWNINYINKNTDCDELAFLFELNGDNVINAKDFSILNKI
ncbi:MAG: S8 family serine peptidase [Eubacterium sp.]